MSQLEDSFIETIVDPNIEVSTELLNLGISELADSETAAKLPIVGGIVALGRTAFAVRDWFFVRNIIAFLVSLNSVSAEKKERWRQNLRSETSQERVGQELLSIIDRLHDSAKAGIAGRLFARCLDGDIDYPKFVTLCEKLDRLFSSDIRNLKTALPENDDDQERFRALGLYSVHYPGVAHPERIAFASNRELVPNHDLEILLAAIRAT